MDLLRKKRECFNCGPKLWNARRAKKFLTHQTTSEQIYLNYSAVLDMTARMRMAQPVDKSCNSVRAEKSVKFNLKDIIIVVTCLVSCWSTHTCQKRLIKHLIQTG